ncbi:hypothetical protein BB561_001641 [Smittium simulii]|uniref:Major facilitator superfamily (MFS) profile domain-containing protein n=1 Tax=Smittium simulii TaxID=133385 RepID=A0A2T9YTX2_9FUNG|nr:hypothetical protein BB561_001641 [Smittium simulii]
MTSKLKSLESNEKFDINAQRTLLSLSHDEENIRKSYLRKTDLRVLPVIVLLYFASSLDRGNIGTATLNGLVEYLRLSSTDQGNVVALFTICYIAFEAPANMLLKKTKPRYWFTFIVTAWSLSTLYLAYAPNAALFIMGRCLLGVFEAGFTPGIVAYLPYWYTREELGSRMSVFFMALPISGMVGGPIAAKLVQTQILNLQRYQGIFFVEGIVTTAIGILTFFIMHDYPDTAKFYTPAEKELMTHRITLDQGLASKAKISRKQSFNALLDWKIYVFSLVGFGPNNCLALLGYFGPTIIASMGYSKTTATYMAGIPYACGIFSMFIVLRYINRIQLWKLYLICIPSNILGASLTAYALKPELRLFGLCLVGVGTCPITPVGMTWMSTNAGSVSKRMISTAIFTTITGLAGFISPYIFTSKYAPKYAIGHGFNIIMLCISLGCALFLAYYFKKENARRDANPVDVSHLSLEELQAMNDRNPMFRYKL